MPHQLPLGLDSQPPPQPWHFLHLLLKSIIEPYIRSFHTDKPLYMLRPESGKLFIFFAYQNLSHPSNLKCHFLPKALQASLLSVPRSSQGCLRESRGWLNSVLLKKQMS